MKKFFIFICVLCFGWHLSAMGVETPIEAAISTANSDEVGSLLKINQTLADSTRADEKNRTVYEMNIHLLVESGGHNKTERLKIANKLIENMSNVNVETKSCYKGREECTLLDQTLYAARFDRGFEAVANSLEAKGARTYDDLYNKTPGIPFNKDNGSFVSQWGEGKGKNIIKAFLFVENMASYSEYNDKEQKKSLKEYKQFCETKDMKVCRTNKHFWRCMSKSDCSELPELTDNDLKLGNTTSSSQNSGQSVAVQQDQPTVVETKQEISAPKPVSAPAPAATASTTSTPTPVAESVSTSTSSNKLKEESSSADQAVVNTGNMTLTGKVVDANNGEGVYLARLKIFDKNDKYLNLYVDTNDQGRFEINNVPRDASIQVSPLGNEYQSLTVNVSNFNGTILLQPKQQNLKLQNVTDVRFPEGEDCSDYEHNITRGTGHVFECENGACSRCIPIKCLPGYEVVETNGEKECKKEIKIEADFKELPKPQPIDLSGLCEAEKRNINGVCKARSGWTNAKGDCEDADKTKCLSSKINTFSMVMDTNSTVETFDTKCEKLSNKKDYCLCQIPGQNDKFTFIKDVKDCDRDCAKTCGTLVPRYQAQVNVPVCSGYNDPQKCMFDDKYTTKCCVEEYTTDRLECEFVKKGIWNGTSCEIDECRLKVGENNIKKIDSKKCEITKCDDGYSISGDKTQCVQNKIDPEKIKRAEEDYKAAKENEQSLANRTLTAATTAATGLGAMELARGLAEQSADKAASADMAAYIETFRCEYGNGNSVKGGPDAIELPGGNNQNMMNYRAQYIALASDLKERKDALGMKPGIESEEILDKTNLGLYDDENVGITGGNESSLYRAMALESESDQSKIDEASAASSRRVKGGAIAAGAGVVGGIAGDSLINGELGKKIKEIKDNISNTKENTAAANLLKQKLTDAGYTNVNKLNLSRFDISSLYNEIKNTNFIKVNGTDITSVLKTSNISDFASGFSGLLSGK